MLTENIERLKSKTKMETQPGTIYRVFETHMNNEKDESGQIPIIVRKEEDNTVKKKKLN